MINAAWPQIKGKGFQKGETNPLIKALQSLA